MISFQFKIVSSSFFITAMILDCAFKLPSRITSSLKGKKTDRFLQFSENVTAKTEKRLLLLTKKRDEHNDTGLYEKFFFNLTFLPHVHMNQINRREIKKTRAEQKKRWRIFYFSLVSHCDRGSQTDEPFINAKLSGQCVS